MPCVLMSAVAGIFIKWLEYIVDGLTDLSGIHPIAAPTPSHITFTFKYNSQIVSLYVFAFE